MPPSVVTPHVVKGSWKQLCKADAFSQRSPGMIWDVFPTKNLALTEAAPGAYPHGSSHIQPLLTLISLRNLSKRVVCWVFIARPCTKVLKTFA